MISLIDSFLVFLIENRFFKFNNIIFNNSDCFSRMKMSYTALDLEIETYWEFRYINSRINRKYSMISSTNNTHFSTKLEAKFETFLHFLAARRSTLWDNRLFTSPLLSRRWILSNCWEVPLKKGYPSHPSSSCTDFDSSAPELWCWQLSGKNEVSAKS